MKETKEKKTKKSLKDTEDAKEKRQQEGWERKPQGGQVRTWRTEEENRRELKIPEGEDIDLSSKWSNFSLMFVERRPSESDAMV